jgi:hypothetical protein
MRLFSGAGRADPAALEIREIPRPQEDAGGFTIQMDCNSRQDKGTRETVVVCVHGDRDSAALFGDDRVALEETHGCPLHQLWKEQRCYAG